MSIDVHEDQVGPALMKHVMSNEVLRILNSRGLAQGIFVDLWSLFDTAASDRDCFEINRKNKHI